MTASSEDEARQGIGDRLPEPTEATVVRFEEEADVRPSGWRGIGFLRARKQVETATIDETLLRQVQAVDTERISADEGDSGKVETLPDGGISIPIFEERLVVRKEVVLKERLVIRKKVVTESERIRTEIRREHVDIDVDDSIADRVVVDDAVAADADGGTDRV